MRKPTGSGADLEFNVMTDMLNRAETAEDVFGGLIVPEGMSYGYGSKGLYVIGGSTLSQEALAWNAGLEIYRCNMQSNANFVGENLFLNYHRSLHLGKIKLTESVMEYEKTGGFVFEKKIDENGIEHYETADEAFPEFNLNELGTAKIKLKGNSSLPIINLMTEFQKINKWSKEVKSKYQGPILDEISGEQTFAGRMVPMLDALFGKLEMMNCCLTKKPRLELTAGLDLYLKSEVTNVMYFLGQHFKMKRLDKSQKHFSMDGDLVGNFMDFFEIDDSGLIKTSATSEIDIYKRLSKLFFDSEYSHGLNVKLRSAVQGIKLMKGAFHAFQNAKLHMNAGDKENGVRFDSVYDSPELLVEPDYDGDTYHENEDRRQEWISDLNHEKILFGPSRLSAEPDFDDDSCDADDAIKRELMLDDLASDADDFTRSDEEGWFYTDKD